MIFKVFQQFMYKQTCYFFSLERSVQFTLTTINYFWTNYLVSSASVNPIYFKEMSKTIKSKNKTGKISVTKNIFLFMFSFTHNQLEINHSACRNKDCE